MIELREEFRKRGLNFKRIYKDADMLIYEVRSNASFWYEVFKRRIRPADRFHEEEYEAYPSDESFGNWAWSCSNKSSLMKIIKREFSNEVSDSVFSDASDLESL